MLNQLLGGHYRVVQNLEEGGLAKTYIAEDIHRPGCPQCAVKFLKPASNQPDFLPTARRLFKQEAEILENLGQHAQIPRLLAYFEENKQFYLVQEFIEGHTLTREMPRGNCWAESKVVSMLDDVLQTLEFVHSYGVIHRDIKPNNLIRRRQDGRLVLIDFGAVKQVRAPMINNYSSSARSTIAIGTQGYMPTEQVRGRPRLNSDIYALGMVGIQALTGLHPLHFAEDEEGELIWQDQVQVSSELATILSRMISYHFKERYQSATETLTALQPLIEKYSLSGNITSLEELPIAEPKLVLANPEAVTTITPQETKIETIQQSSFHLEPRTILQRTKIPSLANLWRSQKQQFWYFVTKILTHKKEIGNSLKLLRFNKFQLALGTGITSAAIGILTGYNYINNRHWQAEQTLAQIEELQTTGKYQECLQQAEVFSQENFYLQAQVKSLWEQCYQAQAEITLAKAKQLAAASKLKDAIALVTQIPQDTDLYAEASELASRWAEQIFQIAKNKYQEGQIQEAIAIAQAVPGDKIAQKNIKTITDKWQQQWQQDQIYLELAQQKFSEGSWQDAINAAGKISEHNYWQRQSQPIIRQAKAQIIAAQTKTQVATTRKQQTTNRQTVNKTKTYSNSRSVNNSRSIRIPRPISKSRPINKSSSLNRSNSSPRYTSKMTCKNKLHPKCPRQY